MRLHDFHKPRLLAEADLRALDTIHRKFARAAADALSVLARTRVECLLSFVAQRPYFDFIRSIENPTHLNLVYCLPQKAPFVLEMGASILFPMIERLLGGRGDKDTQPARPLTRIEQSVAGTIAERFLDALQDAWSAATDLQFDIAETEHNPLLMQIVAPSEPSIVLAFSMAAGARRGAFHLCIPAKPFEPVLGRLTRAVNPGLGSGPASPREREGLLRRLAATEVTISAELASVPIALADLLALRAGDVIDTQLGRGSEVALLVDGKRVFRGLGAVREGRRAVRVTRAEIEE
jgi:flagellar motor switch protein FliM